MAMLAKKYFAFISALCLAALLNAAAPPDTTVFRITEKVIFGNVPPAGLNIDPRKTDLNGIPLTNAWNHDTSFTPRKIWSVGKILKADDCSFSGRPARPFDQYSRYFSADFWKDGEVYFHTRNESAGPFRITASKSNPDGTESFTFATDRKIPDVRNSSYRLVKSGGMELSEKTSGPLRSQLEQPGSECRMTHPSVSWGFKAISGRQAFFIKPSNATSASPQGITQDVPPAEKLAEGSFGHSFRLRATLSTEKFSVPVTMRYGASEWKIEANREKQTFEFTIPQRAQAEKRSVAQMQILAGMPDTIFIHEWVVFRDDAPPYSILPEWDKAISEFSPGTIRTWSLFRADTASALFSGTQPDIEYDLRNPGYARGPSLPAFLSLCRKNNACPWIILNPHVADNELRMLAEYLGAPPDKGFGRLRAMHGQPQPWTAFFRTIYFEAAHEPWNPLYAPLSWENEPEEFAALCRKTERFLIENPYLAGCAEQMISSEKNGAPWSKAVSSGLSANAFAAFPLYIGMSGAMPFHPRTKSDEWQTRLLYAPVTFDKQFAENALAQPEMQRYFAEVILEDETFFKLCIPTLSIRTPRNNWKEDIFKKSFAAAAEKTLEILIKEDDLLLKNTPLNTAHLHTAASKFIINIFWDTLENSQDALKAFALSHSFSDTDALAGLPFIFKIGNANALREFVRKNPELASEIAQVVNTDSAAKSFARTISDNAPIHRSILDSCAEQMIIKTLELPTSKRENLDRIISEAFSDSSTENNADEFEKQSADFAALFAERKSELLCNAAKRNPAFARHMLKQLSSESGKAFIAELSAALEPDEAEYLNRVGSELAKNELMTAFRQKLPLFAGKVTDSADRIIPNNSRGGIITRLALSAGDSRRKNIPARFSNAAATECRDIIYDSLTARISENFMVSDRFLSAAFVKTGRPTGAGIYEFAPVYETYQIPDLQTLTMQNAFARSWGIILATLDSVLLANSRGIMPACHYRLAASDYGYASHTVTNENGSLRPLSLWKMLIMRNSFCKGEMLYVESEDYNKISVRAQFHQWKKPDGSMVTLDPVQRSDVPFESCFAFRNGKEHSAVIINRSATLPRKIVLVSGKAANAKAETAIINAHSPENQSLEESYRESSFNEEGRLSMIIPPCSVTFLRWNEQ